jgi:hypothetical protein
VAEEVDKELVRARVEVLNSYRWSWYPAYVGKVKKPDWLSTESIRQLFGSGAVESFRSAYGRQLKEMAGLGKWEEGWKGVIKASVLHGTEEFVAGMLKELKGDRREQTGMRDKKRLSLEWSRIVAAIEKVWKAPWEEVSGQRGNGVLPRTAASQAAAICTEWRPQNATHVRLEMNIPQCSNEWLWLALSRSLTRPRCRPDCQDAESQSGNFGKSRHFQRGDPGIGEAHRADPHTDR